MAEKVAGRPSPRCTTGKHFGTPEQRAEEALMEAQARLDRAAVDRILAERKFAAELASIRASLRQTTAEISSKAGWSAV